MHALRKQEEGNRSIATKRLQTIVHFFDFRNY